MTPTRKDFHYLCHSWQNEDLISQSYSYFFKILFTLMRRKIGQSYFGVNLFELKSFSFIGINFMSLSLGTKRAIKSWLVVIICILIDTQPFPDQCYLNNHRPHELRVLAEENYTQILAQLPKLYWLPNSPNHLAIMTGYNSDVIKELDIYLKFYQCIYASIGLHNTVWHHYNMVNFLKKKY